MIFSVFQKNWVFGYSWSTLLWYRCYYPRWLRDALSPVCGIFNEKYCPCSHLHSFIVPWIKTIILTKLLCANVISTNLLYFLYKIVTYDEYIFFVENNHILVHISRTQSLASWLKLELSWLGLARRQSQNLSLARIGLEGDLHFLADLGSGSEKMVIYELSSAQARGKRKFWAWHN